MKVVVTGATGFVGFPTANALARRGHTVCAVGRRPAQAEFAAGVTFLVVDLADPVSCDRLLETADVVVHLAWYTTPPGYLHDVRRNLECVRTSVTLLASAYRGGSRLVLGGTCLESVKVQHPTCYAQSKAAVHSLASALPNSLCVHIFSVYGPREDPRRAIPTVIRMARARTAATFGDGYALRDYVHVEDVAEAFALLVESDLTGSVDVCSGSPRPLREILQLAAIAAGGGAPLHFAGDSPAGTGFDAVGDPLPLRSLGWNPRPLQRGLEEAARWWASVDSTSADE